MSAVTEIQNGVEQFYKISYWYERPLWYLRWQARVTFKQIFHQCRFTPKARILEVGCGSGHLTELLQQVSLSTIGIDINPRAIQQTGKTNLHVMDVQHLEFPDQSFDIVVSAHTLEHVPDIMKSLCEIERVLKEGGYFVWIYPYEPIRGLSTVPSAILHYRTLRVCRQMHLHTFTPFKMKRILDSFPLVQKKWTLFFFPGLYPNFLSVLKKIKYK